MTRGNRGGILLYVLGVIALLSLVVTEFLMEAAGEVRYRAQVVSKEDLKLVANSALDVSIAVLSEIKEIEGGLYSPSQGWGNPLEYSSVEFDDAYKVSVKVIDENRKLSLYEQENEALGAFLKQLGLDFVDVKSVTNGVTDWLKEKPQLAYPEEGMARREEPAKKALRPVSSLLELKEIEAFRRVFFDEAGEPNELFEQFQQSVSIYGRGPVNLNTAEGKVQELYFGAQGSSVFDGGKYYKSEDDFKLNARVPILLDGYSFTSETFKIEVHVERGGVHFFLNAIARGKGDKKPNYSILALTEPHLQL